MLSSNMKSLMMLSKHNKRRRLSLCRMKGKMFKGKELKVEFGKGERKPGDRNSYDFS